MRKKIFILTAALLLLTACGDNDLNYPYASDGNYATPGNYATSGDAYYAYATDGDAVEQTDMEVWGMKPEMK